MEIHGITVDFVNHTEEPSHYGIPGVLTVYAKKGDATWRNRYIDDTAKIRAKALVEAVDSISERSQ